MKKQYNNVEYIKGVPETYVYNYTQQGYKHLKPIDMFNGEITGNTISRRTIERLLQE